MLDILKKFDLKKEGFLLLVFCLAPQELKFCPAGMQRKYIRTVQPQRFGQKSV